MRGRVWATGAVIGAIAVVPWLAWWSALPEPMATHWSLGGDANGHLSRVAACTVLAGLAVCLAAGVVVSHRHVTAPVLAFVGAIMATASFGTVATNRDVSSWRAASDPLGYVGLGLLLGIGAALAVRTDEERVADGISPAIDLQPGERVAWTRTTRSTLMMRAAIGVAAIGAFLLVVNPVASIVVLFSAAIVAMFTATTVVVRERGVVVHGALSFARVHIPLARISGATPIDVSPWQWGGWGYRGSLRLLNRAAWVVRRGPGLRLDLTDGKVFVVTIEDPDDAAAVVNGLRVTSTPR